MRNDQGATNRPRLERCTEGRRAALERHTEGRRAALERHTEGRRAALELARRVLVLALLLIGVGSFGCKKLKEMGQGGGDSGGFFLDASAIPTKFTAKVGAPVKVLEMVVYPGWVKCQAQDPKNHEHVDEFELRNGSVGPGAPVKFVGKPPTAKDLDTVTFDIGTIDFAQVPKMVKDAPVQLKLEDGKTTHMILKRGVPFNNDVRWRVYVSGSRGSGSVEYDPQGNMKKVWN